jgi:hypothetical protein
MDDLTDGELWQLATDGSAVAYGVLFERHSQAVYNYCFRRTADWALAEDLCRRRAEESRCVSKPFDQWGASK